MKKVLALALALVMVCTMAMAVTITTTGDPAYNDTTAVNATPIVPGDILYMTLAELAGNTGWYADKDGNFVPANNKVTVTYGKGSDLVKSAGWVQIAENKTDAASWQYQIALKDSETATADGKTVDLSITKVTFKATGEKVLTYTYDGKPNNLPKVEFDYGWPTAEKDLYPTTKAYEIGALNAELAVDTITELIAVTDNDGKAVKENTWTMTATSEWGDTQNWADNAQIVFNVKAGQKILRKDYATDYTQDAKWVNKYGFNGVTPVVSAVNDTNLTGSATVTNWSEKFNAYAVALDGTVTKLAVIVDDGVATIKVPAFSAVAVVEGTLKNVKSASAPAEVTNPGTGANDVVGVAAALAVVALVSGAAISLKK